MEAEKEETKVPSDADKALEQDEESLRQGLCTFWYSPIYLHVCLGNAVASSHY